MALYIDGKRQLGTPAYLGGVSLSDRNGCLACKHFASLGGNGMAGYLKIAHGTTPTSHKEAGLSLLWADSSDKLYLEKADGTDLELGVAADFIKKDGSVALTSDWDIGDTRKILADEIRARDGAALKLYDDGGNGIFVEDGGNVGIGTSDPKRQFDFDGANVRTQRYLDSDLNVNLGFESFGAGNLSGTHNSTLGRHSLYSITSGSGNSGLGNEALYNVTTGGNNVGVGGMSGKGIAGGSHNISLGYKSGYVIASGNNNISIGSYSNYVGTGSKNIIIGYNIDLPVDAGDNQLNIGNIIYGTGLDGVDKTVSTGKVGIGVANPAEKLDVAGNVKISGNLVIPEGKNITDGTNNRIKIADGSTDVYGEGSCFLRVIGNLSIRSSGDFGPNGDNSWKLGFSGARWTEVWAVNGTIQTSDLREKNANYNFEYGLDEVLKLKPISFTWKTGEDMNTHLGLGAQDIQKVIPEIVRGENRLALSYVELMPVLIKAIQEQQKQIDELKGELGIWRQQDRR